MKNIPLNIFQDGVVMKVLVACAYMGALIGALYVLDKVDQGLFLQTLQRAVDMGILTQDSLSQLQAYIDTREIFVVVPLGLLGMFCAFLGMLFMRWMATHNMAWPVTLSTAMEFRPAMNKLGIVSPAEEISLITRHNIQVFIATIPFTHETAHNIRAQLYPFARHDLLSVRGVFEKYIGARKLCITSDAYEHIFSSADTTRSLQESNLLAEKDKEIDVLSTNIIHLKELLESTQQENAFLKAENANFKNKQKTISGRETKRVKLLQKERLQWLVINTVLEHIVESAPVGKLFTEREIMEALECEWQRRSDLHAQMLQYKKTSELEISEALMGATKELLAEAGHFSKKGGRPSKQLKRPAT